MLSLGKGTGLCLQWKQTSVSGKQIDNENTTHRGKKGMNKYSNICYACLEEGWTTFLGSPGKLWERKLGPEEVYQVECRQGLGSCRSTDKKRHPERSEGYDVLNKREKRTSQKFPFNSPILCSPEHERDKGNALCPRDIHVTWIQEGEEDLILLTTSLRKLVLGMQVEKTGRTDIAEVFYW